MTRLLLQYLGFVHFSGGWKCGYWELVSSLRTLSSQSGNTLQNGSPSFPSWKEVTASSHFRDIFLGGQMVPMSWLLSWQTVSTAQTLIVGGGGFVQLDEAEASWEPHQWQHCVNLSLFRLPWFPSGTSGSSYFWSVSQRQGAMAWESTLFT